MPNKYRVRVYDGEQCLADWERFAKDAGEAQAIALIAAVSEFPTAGDLTISVEPVA